MGGGRKRNSHFFFLLALSQNLVAKHWFFIVVSAFVRVSITRCWHVCKENLCSKADAASCMGGLKGFVHIFEKSNYAIVQGRGKVIAKTGSPRHNLWKKFYI